MKISYTGQGNIGSRLLKMGCDPLSFDITNKDEIYAEIKRSKPDVVIHTACVSSPEQCEIEYEKARLVNVRGTANLLDVMSDEVGDGKVVMLSTDHVFDGQQGFYTEEDEPNPINEYGRTKFAAEGLVELYGSKTIRLSRGFDKKSKDIGAYLLALSIGKTIYVPDFIYRSYCHMDFLAEAIFEYAKRFEEMPQLLHLGGQWSISFREFMLYVAKNYTVEKVMPRQQEEGGHANRPLKCGFDVALAQSLQIPIYSPAKSVERMFNE